MKKSKIEIVVEPQWRKPADDPRTFREAVLHVSKRSVATDEGTQDVATVSATVSSETPYMRMMIDPESGESIQCYEVLGHKEGEIDFSRMADGLVIQDTHWGDQVGIIREPTVKDDKIGGEIEFGCGERAQEIKRDAAAGIRRNMSVGYIVNAYEKTGEKIDGVPVFRVTNWTPYEASFVNVPADTSIGVGRVAGPVAVPGKRAAADEPSAVKTEERQMDPKTIAALMAQAERAHMKAADVSAMIESGKDENAIRAEIAERALALAEEAVKRAATPAKPIFGSGEEKTIAKRYNVANVIRALAGDRSVDIGYERELSDEMVRAGRKCRGDILVPDAALSRAFDKTQAAASLVATDTLFGNAIEALVAETVLGKAGVTTLSGLVGDISIPKLGAATAYWIASEGGDATESTPNVGQVAGTPHTIGAYTDITRRLLNQSGISAQNFIADALRSALARGIEAAAFSGTGTGGQPTGLDSTTGVNAITMTAGAPTKAELVQFWSTLYAANVNGAKAFIGSPAVKGLLASTLDKVEGAKSTITAGRYLCQDDKVEGYDFLMSNLCGSGKLYFGDWSNLVLAFWSGLDLTVDTSSLSKSGGVRVVALQDMDVLVRHAEAFAVGTAIA